ncbi:MAG: hypothetical protein ACXWMU_00870 [Candidatus Limnocylindrales bacterium]
MSPFPSTPTAGQGPGERTPLDRRLEGLDGAARPGAPDLAFLLGGATWRDSFLHGFRSLYLIMEVILLGLATGLLGATFTLDLGRATVTAGLLVVAAIGSLVVLGRMRRATVALGDDVRFWHREIVRAERELPPERRVFTRFKLLQHARHVESERLVVLALSEQGLDEAGLDELIEPFSPTRRLLENGVPALIALLWGSFVAAGLGVLALRAAGVIG